ncbi:hypothetical protein GBA52_010716 [Prunus armeniaca]|nr:hypothetical protein GBA52_010716 [Prunus armeniaca]
MNSTKDNLVAVLDSGFGLKWDTSNNLCKQCNGTGGQCGYNTSTAEFTCYCKDGPNPSNCAGMHALPLPASPTPHPNAVVFPPLPQCTHSSSFSSSSFFFYSFEVTTSFPSNANLSNCSQAFDCGPLRNLSYPFTGGSRPDYCGPPEFHINCVDDSPELTILSLSYRVLQLDPVRRNLKLARSDLWTSTCTDMVFNSTMKSEFFAYNESDDVDVTIFYGCNSTNTTPKLGNRFHCNNNRAFNDSYYLIGPVPLDPIMSTFKCEIGITVPILKTTAAKLVANRSLFQEAINEGFTVNYTNPYDNQCAQCLGVNGLCGFDSGSSEPVCICGHRVCDPAGKLQDGRVVAVKRLYENNFKRVEQFMNEVEILTRLEHRNLVKLYGCTSRRSRELLLVYEYIPNGTVADHLHGKRVESGFLSWPVRLSIAIETADALAFLHRNDVIHRDVKTNNILIDNDFCVKVADFGLSRLFPNDVTHVSTAPQGTPGYVDPEYYQCYQLTDKSDVYSFGVVLIELISSLQAVDTNRHRHDINLANMAINKIQNHLVNELVDPLLEFETNHVVRGMATAVAELAFRCLQQERDMRPTMDEVLDGLRAIQNEDLGSEDGQAVVLDIRGR